MRYRTLGSAEADVLRTVVFAETPEHLLLAPLLNSNSSLQVLEINDRGTTGLCGPTRADTPSSDGEERDFVDFLRNVGQPPTKIHGGGTYGYGKAAAYLASDARTICVHTHTTFRGEKVSRFMGAGLGEQYESTRTDDAGIYTGRHWWGRLAGDVVDPVEGDEADAIAKGLAMPTFDTSEFGTTIMVVQPALDIEAPREAMQHLAASMAWNFWPKMISQEAGGPRMIFRVICEQDELPVPDPRTTPPLTGFVGSLLQLDSGAEEGIFPVESQRPAQHLGFLSLTKFFAEDNGRLTTGEAPGAPLTDRCHHVALLRTPRLVVKYVAGPRLVVDVAEYAGVFLVDEALDDVFARSEPPAHDDWIAGTLLERRDRVFVNVAFRQIAEQVEEFAGTRRSDPPPGEQAPLGLLSQHLGGLLPGVEATGVQQGRLAPGGPRPGGSTRPGPSRPPTSQARARVVMGTTRLEIVDGQPAVEIRFAVEHAADTGGTRLSVRAAALLEGAELESEPPEGAAVPTVLAWKDGTGNCHGTGPSVDIPRDSTGEWQVLIRPVQDAQTGIQLVPEPYR